MLYFPSLLGLSRTPCGFTTDTAAFEAVIGCGHPLSIEIEAKASPFIRLKPTTALVTPYLGQGDAARGHQTRDATTHAYYYKYCYVRRGRLICVLLKYFHMITGKDKNFLLSKVKYSSIIEPNQKSRPKSTTREHASLLKLAASIKAPHGKRSKMFPRIFRRRKTVLEF